MPINRIQVAGSNPSPDRQDTNLVAGGSVVLTATDDSANNVSKITVSGGSAIYRCHVPALSAVASGTVVGNWVPGFAGTITKISGYSTVAPTTASKAATFTPAISAVAISGGALAVNTTAAATVGTRIDGSAVAGLATFTATQAVTVVASAVTAFVEGQMVIDVFYTLS